MGTRAAALSLAACSMAVGLYLGELALQFGIGARRGPLWEELRERPDAVPAVMPRAFMQAVRSPDGPWGLRADGPPLLPLAGLSGRLTVACRDTAGRLVFTSDEHGFHNPPGLWSRSPLEVAIVGDSFAMGVCVESAQGLAAHVRHRYPATLNLGYSGNGPLLELAAIKEYLPPRRPRHVTWLYYAGNDLLDLRVEHAHPVWARYLQPGFRQGLEGQQPMIDRDLLAVVAAGSRPTAWHRMRQAARLPAIRSRLARVLRLPEPAPPTPEDVSMLAGVLAEAQRTVKDWNGSLEFVYLPSWQELFEPQPRADHLREQVLAAARSLGLTVVDLSPRLRALGPAAFACPRDCHYSAAGYRAAAERVLEALSVSSRVPSGPRSAS